MVTSVTFFVCFYFGKRFGGDNDFERTIGLYGTSTGTVPTGIALVRIVDPNFKTNTAVELGLTNIVMMASTWAKIPALICLLFFCSAIQTDPPAAHNRIIISQKGDFVDTKRAI